MDSLRPLAVFFHAHAELGTHTTDAAHNCLRDVQHATHRPPVRDEVFVLVDRVHFLYRLTAAGEVLPAIRVMRFGPSDVWLPPIIVSRSCVVVKEEQMLDTHRHKFGDTAVLGCRNATGFVVTKDSRVRFNNRLVAPVVYDNDGNVW